ncbi:MAG: VWA domain-containing protein [Acidobacteriia bacterium]|nr:VWA domain-containing protein [Terriglobia bacterium]
MLRRVAICLIGSLGSVAAQDSQFHVQTKVVQVPVTVAGKDGRNVDGLAAGDFLVLDNGVRQEVTLDDFSTSSAPISLAIVIQTSKISTPALAKIHRIGGMIQPLVTGQHGQVAVATFNSRIQWVQDFTSDDDKIRSAMNSVRAGLAMQDARMLDAVALAAGHLEQRLGRKILLLISESRDRGSETKVSQALEAVGREGIEVFAAHYSAYATSLIAKPKDQTDLSAPPEFPNDPTEAPNPPPSVNFLAILSELARMGKTNTVQALTQATGGSDYPFLKERGIESAIEKLGVEVHSQYLLSFPQRGEPSGMHEIEVSVPSRADLRIRSRRVYWTDPAGDAQSKTN